MIGAASRKVLWTSADASAATGGRALQSWTAFGVSIDSRTLAAGDLFVALKGPNFDGHSFVADALSKGAGAAVVERIPEGVAGGAPLLVVGDAMEALRALGRAARARSLARIIAVTGSVGKTGVKEALRLVLGAQGDCAANDGSLNNHWGLPLSLARMPADTVFGVFEMGMNHPGELLPLTTLARPHVAAITTVEAVHIENFQSVEDIADAKAEILTGVEPGGAAVLNRDNPHFARLADAAGRAGITRIVDFGRHADAQVRLLEARMVGSCTHLHAQVGDSFVQYVLTVPGSHWWMNSLCVLAAVLAVGADVGRAARSLAEFGVPKGRGQRIAIDGPDGRFQLIDDSYNASPVSMRAAFEVLGSCQPEAGGRRIAVLGDMLELGGRSTELHRALARPLAENGIDLVFACGPAMAHLFAALPQAARGAHAKDSSELAPIVAEAVRGGDVVVVKGSAGSRMARVVEALKALTAASSLPLPVRRAANGE